MTEEKDEIPLPREQVQREYVLDALRRTYLIMDGLDYPESRASFIDMLCAHYDYRPEPNAGDLVRIIGDLIGPPAAAAFMGMMGKGGPTGVVKEEATAPVPPPNNPCPRCGKYVVPNIHAFPPTVDCPHCGWSSPITITPA